MPEPKGQETLMAIHSFQIMIQTAGNETHVQKVKENETEEKEAVKNSAYLCTVIKKLGSD